MHEESPEEVTAVVQEHEEDGRAFSGWQAEMMRTGA
jgi:hypothetical protein